MIGKSGKSGFIMPTVACALIGAAVAVVDGKYSDYAYYHHINIPDWLFVLMLLLNAPRILFVAFIDKQPTEMQFLITELVVILLNATLYGSLVALLRLRLKRPTER